ncbi:MAG: hypothetical protein PF483_08580, partial [Halothiobacillus sp.]|nr:hypothetical protein [Halothiobacillus sp.]
LDFSVVFEGYAGGAEHRLCREASEIVLSGPIFSGPDDCADLVKFFQHFESMYKNYSVDFSFCRTDILKSDRVPIHSASVTRYEIPEMRVSINQSFFCQR